MHTDAWGCTSALELPCVSWEHLWTSLSSRYPYLAPQGPNFCTELLHLWDCFCIGIQPLIPPCSAQGACCCNPAPSPDLSWPHEEPLGTTNTQPATSTASLGAAGHSPQLFPQLCHAHPRLTSPYPSGQLLLLVLVLPSWGNSSRKTGESRSSLPTSANCRGLWLATWGCRGLLGSRKLSTWPNKPPVLCNQRGGRQRRPGALGGFGTIPMGGNVFGGQWEQQGARSGSDPAVVVVAPSCPALAWQKMWMGPSKPAFIASLPGT